MALGFTLAILTSFAKTLFIAGNSCGETLTVVLPTLRLFAFTAFEHYLLLARSVLFFVNFLEHFVAIFVSFYIFAIAAVASRHARKAKLKAITI